MTFIKAPNSSPTPITTASPTSKRAPKTSSTPSFDVHLHSHPSGCRCAPVYVVPLHSDPNYRDRDERYAGREKHIRKARPQEHQRLTQEDFQHDSEVDCYTCPKGQKLLRQNGTSTTRGGKGKYAKYAIENDFCSICELRERCLTKNGKRRTLSICLQSARPHCKAMREKVDTSEARERYSYRMGTIEPIFAHIRHAKGLHRINYRGREKVGVIWNLWAIMHNICKLTLYRPEFGTKGHLRA